jgi:Domain of unknown function (DUF5915)
MRLSLCCRSGFTVVLDTHRDDALRREGLAREIVNRVQSLRKSKGLAVSDRIALELRCSGELAATAMDPVLIVDGAAAPADFRSYGCYPDSSWISIP